MWGTVLTELSITPLSPREQSSHFLFKVPFFAFRTFLFFFFAHKQHSPILKKKANNRFFIVTNTGTMTTKKTWLSWPIIGVPWHLCVLLAIFSQCFCLAYILKHSLQKNSKIICCWIWLFPCVVSFFQIILIFCINVIQILSYFVY